jgi:hypothetical protein
MSRSRRMRINERSIVSTPIVAALVAGRSEEAGSLTGSHRRSVYASVSRPSVASGWKASFMSV